MSSEKFCLKWNDFESNISGAFRELRDEKDFFDVTLACDDNQIKAHKVIISACSPFFRNVLRQNPHQHPLLYMRGVNFTDLQSVLTFMYQGEVNVAQEDLNTFLAVAEDLKVKGLTQNQTGSNSSNRPASKPEVKQPKPPDREIKRAAPAGRPHSMAEPDDDDIQEVMPVKTEPAPSQADLFQQDPQQSGQLQQFDDGAMEYGDYEDYGHQYDETGQQLVDGGGGEAGKGDFKSLEDFDQFISENGQQGGKACGICYQYNSNVTRDLRNHIESKHFPNTFNYRCLICGLNLTTNKAFSNHKSRCKNN